MEINKGDLKGRAWKKSFFLWTMGIDKGDYKVEPEKSFFGELWELTNVLWWTMGNKAEPAKGLGEPWELTRVTVR